MLRLIILILLLGGYVSNSIAVSAKTEIKVNDSITFDVKVMLVDDLYQIELKCELLEYEKTSLVSNFTSSVLKSYISSALREKNKNLSDVRKKKELDERITSKFLELQVILANTPEEGQKITVIELLDSAYVYRKIEGKVKRRVRAQRKKEGKGIKVEKGIKIEKYKIIDAQIEFDNGFIRNIIVSVMRNDTVEYFSNMHGFGITTRTNIQRLKNGKLFNEHNDKDKRYFLLGDILRYNRVLGIKTNDYSPKNSKILLAGEEKKALYKESSRELFKLNIFTDFVGLNEKNPNGLVQTELSKRINFMTTRKPFNLWKSGVGVFTHLRPFFELTKIEENNRSIQGNQRSLSDTVSYLSPLEVFRYSASKTGCEFNLLDIQGAAVDVKLNYSIGLAVTSFRDSIYSSDKLKTKEIKEDNINSVFHGGAISFEFKPNSKWRFKISDNVRYFNSLDDSFEYFSPSNDKIEEPNRLLNTVEFLATWSTGSGNNLFGRIRLNHEFNNSNNNFSQFQLGYSISLRPNSKKK